MHTGDAYHRNTNEIKDICLKIPVTCEIASLQWTHTQQLIDIKRLKITWGNGKQIEEELWISIKLMKNANKKE